MALRILRYGTQGEDVKAVQKGLNSYFSTQKHPPKVPWYPLVPDGKFGPMTRDAVDAFQRANPGTGNSNGSPDGSVGPHTRLKLFPIAVRTHTIVIGHTDKSKNYASLPYLDGRTFPWPIQSYYSPLHISGLKRPISAPDLRNVPIQLEKLYGSNHSESNQLNIHVSQLSVTGGTTSVITPIPIDNQIIPSSLSSSLGIQRVDYFGNINKSHWEFTNSLSLNTPNFYEVPGFFMKPLPGDNPFLVGFSSELAYVDKNAVLGNYDWTPNALANVTFPLNGDRPSLSLSLFPLAFSSSYGNNDDITITINAGATLTTAIYNIQSATWTAILTDQILGVNFGASFTHLVR